MPARRLTFQKLSLGGDRKKPPTSTLQTSKPRRVPMKTRFAFVAGVASVLLAGCTGGDNANSNDQDAVTAKQQVLIPGVLPTTNFSFDISDVDSGRGLMFFTDRNNAAVDVINVKNNTFVKQIKGGF